MHDLEGSLTTSSVGVCTICREKGLGFVEVNFLALHLVKEVKEVPNGSVVFFVGFGKKCEVVSKEDVGDLRAFGGDLDWVPVFVMDLILNSP